MKERRMSPHTYKIFSRIVLFALIAHITFAVLFGCINIFPMMLYNIFSLFFYIMISLLLHKQYYNIVTASIHIEIFFFVTVTTIYLGWDLGYSLYLIALCSLLYFCPYRNLYIPYYFSIAEILLFLMLKIYCSSHAPLYVISSETTILLIYCYNSLLCFAVIVYAAFISNLSAVFTKQELLAQNNNLQTLINHDELTQLHTRTYLKEKSKNFCKDSKKLSSPAFLIMADIDNFKYVNDTYGHLCGDYVLFTLAAILKTVCPSGTDIVRWGGEEFVIIMYDSSKHYVVEAIQKLRETISSYDFQFEGNKFHITMTFGISSTEEYEDFGKLLSLADERMYHGKSKGKNIVISSD